MVQFRKRKSDGQSFPIGSTTKIRANNPSNQVGGITRKGIRVPSMQSTRTDPSGDTFFFDGKPFKVELDQGLGIIAVDERFQDSRGDWRTGKNVFFAQGEDGQEIAEQSGGWFVDKIMEFLDSAGTLQIENVPESVLKERVLSNLSPSSQEKVNAYFDLKDMGILTSEQLEELDIEESQNLFVKLKNALDGETFVANSDEFRFDFNNDDDFKFEMFRKNMVLLGVHTSSLEGVQ